MKYEIGFSGNHVTIHYLERLQLISKLVSFIFLFFLRLIILPRSDTSKLWCQLALYKSGAGEPGGAIFTIPT